MSYLSYLLQYSKILLTGFIAFNDPSTNNTKIFARNLSEIFIDENNQPLSQPQYTSTLDETKDIQCNDNDSQDIICQICMSNKRNVVFIPCVHSVSCVRCTKELINSTNKCPICNSNIKDSIFYFVS